MTHNVRTNIAMGKDPRCKRWVKVLYEWKLSRTGHTHKRRHKDVVFGVFGLLRQVWACVGVKNVPEASFAVLG